VSIVLVGIAIGCSTGDFHEDCVERPVRVHEIQGASHDSPLVGRCLGDVRGVVTATVREEGTAVIWIQDPEPDEDPATSEGLAVALEERLPVPDLGDRVSVRGVVEELGHPSGLTTTTLVAQELDVIGHGQLPEPVLIGSGGRRVPTEGVDDDGLTAFEPARDAIDFFESLEGMRVRIGNPVVVGPTTRYGEIVVLGDRGEGAAPRTTNGGLVLRPEAASPTRILVGDRIHPDPPMLRVGERLSGDIVGILDYSFGNFKLYNTEPLPAASEGGAWPGRTELRSGGDRLTVASFNVENLSPRSGRTKFRRLARIIAQNLGSPDIVAVQEIQDDSGPQDDGTVTASATLGHLVDAIIEAGGPEYGWRQIDPGDDQDGGAPGGNIRVATLFNPARVRAVDRPAEGIGTRVASGPSLIPSPGLVAPDHPAFAGLERRGFEASRKPLAVEFEFAGRSLFIVNLHLSSKRGDDALFGLNQPPRYHTEKQRTEQARTIRDFVDRILELDDRAAVVVLGDLNEFEFRPPLLELSSGGLVNLIERVPIPSRYSYIFQGFSQTLDHILVSPALASASEIEMVHLNADFPVSERASDHDPIVARFTLTN
jgi:predicted extracellular nuclease